MKKVLIVFNHPAPYKVRLYNELAKDFNLSVIFERGKNKDRLTSFYSETNYKFNNIKIRGLKLGNENFISCGVKNHIKNNHYDLILMNGYSQFAEMKAIRYMQKHKIPYGLFINGGIIKHNESQWKRKLKTSYISKANFFLSPDLESNKYLIYYGANEKNIFNYPYSTIYENEVLQKKPTTDEIKSIKKEFGIQGNVVYVTAGQLIKRKNYQVLIQSWKNMPQDSHLYIFGDGKERGHYSKIIRDLQVNNVHLCGFLEKEKLLKVFSVSDVFVFPSSEDIYGHVINEALSQGLPVISNTNVNSAIKLVSPSTGCLTSDFSAANIIKLTKQIQDHCTFESCINVARQNTIEKMVESISKTLSENHK